MHNYNNYILFVVILLYYNYVYYVYIIYHWSQQSSSVTYQKRCHFEVEKGSYYIYEYSPRQLHCCV